MRPISLGEENDLRSPVVQWTGGYAARFEAFFVALGFLRFSGESPPAHLPLTPAVAQLVQQEHFAQF